MKKTFKVVMLPTEKASALLISSERDTKNQLLFAKNYNFDMFDHNKNFKHTNKQHLYIISDDEIKEGDWFTYNDCLIKHCTKVDDRLVHSGGMASDAKSLCRKIVATTDKSLTDCNVCGMSDGNHKMSCKTPSLRINLPSIPESFIQAYIKAYNEGKPITEVDLEMEEVIYPFAQIRPEVKPLRYYTPKTRPDNTVIVHQSKMYSRDEVIKIIEKYHEAWVNRPIYDNDEDPPIPSQWIQDNLK